MCRRGWLVALVMALTGALTGALAQEQDSCQIIRGHCQLKTTRSDPYSIAMNISCYCMFGEEVSEDLRKVEQARCWGKPSSPAHATNSSTLHLAGCSVANQPVPGAVWRLLRRTRHLEVVVLDAPRLRLATPLAPEASLPSVALTFINSNVSGLPERVVSGTERAQVLVQGGELGVVEARAFSFPDHAAVNVTFLNTTILTLKMKAFQLSAGATMQMTGGRVLAWDKGGFAGGTALRLRGVVLGRLMGAAINLYGLHTFEMAECTVAEVLDQALHVVALPQRSWEQGMVAEARLVGNDVVNASGTAFVRLCRVDQLVWRNNTFVNIIQPPLRLQTDQCDRERKWDEVVALTGLPCLTCSAFPPPDQQSCAIYKSGYCSGCQTPLDGCNLPVLAYLRRSCSAATYCSDDKDGSTNYRQGKQVTSAGTTPLPITILLLGLLSAVLVFCGTTTFFIAV